MKDLIKGAFEWPATAIAVDTASVFNVGASLKRAAADVRVVARELDCDRVGEGRMCQVHEVDHGVQHQAPGAEGAEARVRRPGVQ